MFHSDVEKVLGQQSKIKLGGVFEVECKDADGNVKWKEVTSNLIVNAGLNHILDVIFHGETAVDPWYVGCLATGATVAAGDTMASHAGWTEATPYADNRKEYDEAAASSQSITNSANKASFAINNTATISGAFINSLATGTGGVLMCGATFAEKSVASNDTLEVTYTLSAADAG